MISSFSRLLRFARTAFTLGGGVSHSIKLVWHVLRTEGPAGIAWRLRNAKNLSEGSVDPWQQFFLDGGGGKQPFPVERFAQLWSGEDESLLGDLRALLHREERGEALPDAAIWTLARWYAKEARWSEVEQVLAPTIDLHLNRLMALPLGIKLLWADALLRQGQLSQSMEFLEAAENAQSGLVNTMDFALARANVLQAQARQHGADPDHSWLQAVNHRLGLEGLLPVCWLDMLAPRTMGNLGVASGALSDSVSAMSAGPLVSVIVPAYNAATTLPVALRSLVSQSWQSLEILVVDDCSTDGTAAIAESFARQDGRVRLVQLPHNQGAYRARNAGLRQATGEFITVHDSDDWSHAQKIETQVRALLEQPRRQISFSHWVRATEDLVFGGWQSPENWSMWVHRNTSSMMMRRAVFERLGYWDNVRCSADVEYYYRAMRVWGMEAMTEVKPGIPLSLGLTAPGSLTQQSATSIFTIFGGLRKQYHDAFHAWHQQSDPRDPRSLYLEECPTVRSFPVPEALLKKLQA